jgi:hypothetical protein
MDKYPIRYQAYDLKTSLGGKAVVYRCGRIIGKEDIDSEGICQMAIDSGDLKSLNLQEAIAFLNVIDATKTKAMYMGKRVKTPHAIMQYNLNGQLGANDTIGSNTRLVLNVTARGAEGKPSKNLCTFTNVGDLANVSISSIATVGGKSGEWVKNKNVIVTGLNLFYDSTIGDSVQATFTVEGEERTIDLVVKGSQENSMELTWHEDLFYVAAGEEVTLTFTLHGGNKDVTAKVLTKNVKMTAA